MKLFSFFFFLIFCFLTSGCAIQSENPDEIQGPKKVIIKRDNQTDVSSEKHQLIVSNNHVSHLTQCNRDLESLRTVSLTEYRRYLAEYDGLMKSSADFMTVKDDVSPEVADLARPKFQFALVNLCYRIKDALAQTLINQAGGR